MVAGAVADGGYATPCLIAFYDDLAEAGREVRPARRASGSNLKLPIARQTKLNAANRREMRAATVAVRSAKKGSE